MKRTIQQNLVELLNRTEGKASDAEMLEAALKAMPSSNYGENLKQRCKVDRRKWAKKAFKCQTDGDQLILL